jgi:predicted kinase
MKDRGTIYLLLGQKGSGKSYIGTLFDREFNVKFLRVEDWAKEIKKDRHFENDEYLSEVFRVIENGVRKSLESHTEIVFESTGLTNQFDKMLSNLKRDYRVITIGIQAGHELCLSRVKRRDQAIHIDVSEAQVQHINQQVLARAIGTDFVIVNNDSNYDELKNKVFTIIRAAAS